MPRETFALSMRRAGRALLVFATLWLGAPGTAKADVYDDNPATAARKAGELYVFERAADGATLARVRNGSEWGAWTSLGGVATSGPAALAYGDSILVFVRGTDGGIYQKSLDGNNHWSDWVALGGYATSAPAVSARRGASGVIDLAYRGGDSAIWHRAWVPTSGWTPSFVTIGGSLTSAPAMNSQSPDILNVWARGTDGQVYQRAWNGSAWLEWGPIGGGILGAPAAVSRTSDTLNVYARGVDNRLYSRSWLPGVWFDWALLDAMPLDSSPAAGGDGPDHEWVVARTGNDLALKEWVANAGWGAWQGLGQVALPPPPPPSPTPPGPPASAPLPDGQADLTTGLRCTPAAGRLRVSVAVKRPKGGPKPRVTKIVFYTKGKGRRVRVDRKAPFEVRIQINRPAGSTGRVYARVYYRRSAHGPVHRKLVSRRYTVCR